MIAFRLRLCVGQTKGEIATTLTIITVVVMAAGALIGSRLNTTSKNPRSQATDFGDVVLKCDSGIDPYNSNTIVITNNSDQTIEKIESNVYRCKYEPGRVRKGYYKCEDNCTGDGPDCQEGKLDSAASQTIKSLAPGQTTTVSVTAGPCEIVQIDAFNDAVYNDDSPYECTNVRSQYTIEPGKRWYGGIAFGISENSNCSGTPQAPTNTPVPNNPLTSPTPAQLSCSSAFTGGTCKPSSQCTGILESKGDYGCTAPGGGGVICCAQKAATLNQVCGQGNYPNATCKLKSDCIHPLYQDVGDQGCNFPGTTSLTCCQSKLLQTIPSPTPTKKITQPVYSATQCYLALTGFCVPAPSECDAFDRAKGTTQQGLWSTRNATYGCAGQTPYCCAPKNMANQPTWTPTPARIQPLPTITSSTAKPNEICKDVTIIKTIVWGNYSLVIFTYKGQYHYAPFKDINAKTFEFTDFNIVCLAP